MNKSFWIILGVAIAGLVGIFLLSGGKAGSNDTGKFAYTEPLLDAQSHDYTVGSGEKGTIVEYADFQCVFCGAYFPVLQQVKQKYPDVKIIFRNFPIPTSHAQSMAAHRAAGAAANQGKFWEMHDQLFANQETWSGNTGASTIFEGYAESLGLNMDQFKADVQSDLVLEKINSDLDSGKTVRVTGTPAIFFNSQKLDKPPTTIEDWTALIEPKPAQ